MVRKRRTPGELRRACLDEARRQLRAEGAEKLSLRTVARRLGVSHQAPYKHFSSKEALLAELVRESFDDFARHLESVELTDDPSQDLRSLGVSYVRYALSHPAEYRLMFGTPLPDPRQHPEMTAQACAALELLEDTLVRLQPSPSSGLDALFAWSTLHGLSTLLQTRSCELRLTAPQEEALAHTLECVCRGLSLAHPEEDV